MGHKWMEAFSKAMTYLGSGMTALTGTLQAAQQQEQIDAAWAALLHTPDMAVVSETSMPQAAPMDALRGYLEQAGITAPVPEPRGQERPTAPPTSLAMGVEKTMPSDKRGSGTPAEEKPWEIDPPAETLYAAVQDAGDGLTGGDIGEMQGLAKEVDEVIHGGPLYGEYADPPIGAVDVSKTLAVPPSADGMPPKMLSGNRGEHFQGTYTLKPNQTYTANGAMYHTDKNGTIQSWSATLTGSKQAAPRAPSHQKHLPGKLEGDHAGHYLAASEGGSGLADNLVPMDAKVNTRDYRAFERENHKFLEEGYTVQLDGSSYMGSSALRPDGIMVTRSVYDSEGNLQNREHFSWSNTDMSQYQDNDFGTPGIPNAMDESLGKAGITREEIAALEGNGDEKKSSRDRKEAERADWNKSGEEQGELTVDRIEDVRRRSEQKDLEKEYEQPVALEKTVPEDLRETAQLEHDVTWTSSQLDQKQSGTDQMASCLSNQRPEKAEEQEGGQMASENQQQEPGERKRADQSSCDTRGEHSGQTQTESRRMDSGGALRPWEKDSGEEAEKAKQVDGSQEPWKKKEMDRDSGEKRNEVDQDKDSQQSDNEDQTPWKKENGQGEDAGGRAQDTAPLHTPKQDVTPTEENGLTAREPWRRDAGDVGKTSNQSQQEELKREKTTQDTSKAEPEELPKETPPSQDDSSTKNKDGGYHY